MLFQKDDAGKILFTAPSTTPWAGQQITTHITICDNPTCRCEQIEASFFLNDMALGDSLIDFVGEEFIPPKTPIHKPMAARFGIAMCEHLTPEDWQLLSETYLASKREVTNNIDLSKFVPQFPYAASIEVAGKMVPFSMILPYGEKLTFSDKNGVFEIDDLYCVKKDCDCAHASLAFVDKDYEYEFEGPPKLLWDYRAEKIKRDDKVDRTPSAETLLASAQTQIPNLVEKLTERHETLRKLYRNFRVANASSQAKPSLPRIGRNESCPCGSGKKYKKCCG